MIRYAVMVSLLLSTSIWAQPISFISGESSREFALRHGPSKSELAHDIIETSEWAKAKKAVIAFYAYDMMGKDGSTEGRIDGFIFLPNSDQTYRKIKIGTFEDEGGPVRIHTVFFATFRGRRKLFVMCKWPQLLHADFSGTAYSTFAYDMPVDSSLTELRIDRELSKKFESSDDLEFRDGRVRHAKYKTANAIRHALKQMK